MKEKIIYLNLDEIKPYEKNPRKNEEAVEYVKNSIKEFGFRNPILLDKNKAIIAGHTRYQASKELGLNEVPCIICEELSDDKVKALRLADNKVSEFASWDFDLLDEELENIDIDMSDFGFDLDDLDLNINTDVDLKDNNKDFEEKESEKVTCPNCGLEFTPIKHE